MSVCMRERERMFLSNLIMVAENGTSERQLRATAGGLLFLLLCSLSSSRFRYDYCVYVHTYMCVEGNIESL